MDKRGRWLIWLLPLGFLGLILGVGFWQDRDFWSSATDLQRSAQDAASRGKLPQALELARKAWSREPENSQRGIFLGHLCLEAGQPGAALEASRRVWTQDGKATGALELQARALELLGKRRASLELLAGYLKEHEDADLLHSAAVLAARRPEDYPLAVTYYQRLYQLKPSPGVRRPLVDLLVNLNRFKEALPLQEEEAAQFPEDQEALHLLALLHYWQQDYAAATQIYQRLLERAAQDATLRVEAAKSAEAAKDVDQALRHYLWLYAHYQGKAEYALALARLWSKKGNHAEAVAVLAPLMQAQPQPEPELKRFYGLELVLIGDFPKALTAYQSAWEAGDTHVETIVNLARLYARKGQFAKAAAFWDEARRRQLLKGDLSWEAALTYSYARRYPEALEVLKPLKQRHPKDPRLLLFAGQLHFYQKHWGQAAHYFKAYLEANPGDVEVRRQLAEILSFKDETREEALSQYGQAIKLRDDVGLRLRRIALLLQARRWEEAARELKECPTPADPRLLKSQAHLFLWLGDLEGALKHYDLFLAKSPQDRGGRLDKARVLTYLGRIPQALELLNRLRQELPQDPAVRVAAIEAYLSGKDFSKALILAQKELEPLDNLGLDERALVARCYAHSEDARHLNRAVDLLIKNLRRNRYHHPSLLILASLLPRLPKYEDLNRLVYRIPGIKVGGPEYVTALAFFDGNLGRHGGKLDYLLHVLGEYRRHKWPDNPGELLGLAWLAMELGNRQAAAAYYRKALRLRPQDQSIARLLVQCQLAQKDWGHALASLKKQGNAPATALEMARVYLMRGQYEGVRAAVARIPETHPDYSQGVLLMIQACRLEGDYPQALKVLAAAAGRLPRGAWLMEKARTLEAMGDKGAVGVYQEIIQNQSDSPLSRVARARQARARGNWDTAYKAFAQALKEAPQDIELLNELEQVRQQMRPELASRGFPGPRGQRRPEEALRPWQFSRFDREPQGLGLSNYFPGFLVNTLPIVQPETLGFTDHNKLYGGIFRLSGAFWITKVLPARVSLEYREYNQNTRSVDQQFFNLGLDIISSQTSQYASRLRRAEVSLGLGPLSVTDRLRISGELILRRYWRRVDRDIAQQGKKWHAVPGGMALFDETARLGVTEKEDRDRLFGSLEVGFALGPRTDVTLKYSRKDIFDQEGHLYPRLYQGVLNLEKVRLTTLHQGELSHRHQFRPGLDWRGNVGGAFFSDHNRRLTLYQGLAWQALGQPRMHLEFTPHVYLAAYRQRQEAYFSPHHYLALGLGVDFDRQIFRLPTLILQGTVQAVGQHGDWGPALQGLAALEWELIHNFYADLHFFYFREWVDDYWLLTGGASFRWRF